MPLLATYLNSKFGTCSHCLAACSIRLIISKLAELDWGRSGCSPRAPGEMSHCSASPTSPCSWGHSSVHLNGGEATSLLTLPSELNRRKNSSQNWKAASFWCIYCVEPPLPGPVSRQSFNRSSSDWQGGVCVDFLLPGENQTNGISVSSRGQPEWAWTYGCVCVCLLHAECKGVEKVEHAQGSSWKDRLGWAAYSHCPWMPGNVVWSSAEIRLFHPLSSPKDLQSTVEFFLFYAELPFFISLLISCFMFRAAELLQSFPFSTSKQLSRKKENAPKTFCKVTLLSITASYPGGNSSLFALFKATPLHTWYSSQMPGVYLPPGLFILKWPMETAHIFVLIRIQSWKLIELLSLSFSLTFTLFNWFELFNLQLI